MRLIDWIREHGQRGYDLTPANETIDRAKMVEERIDKIERKVSERTGHPIGDVIERRRPPAIGQKGGSIHAFHY